MEFLKSVRFSILGKLKGRKDPDQDGDQPSEPKEETLDAAASDRVSEGGEDEDDDDFITNEVKRRLEQLRKSSFLVLIPEEEFPEGEEEEESSSSGSKESDMDDAYPSYGFEKMYKEYTEKMLFFDQYITKHLKEAGMTFPNAKYTLDSYIFL